MKQIKPWIQQPEIKEEKNKFKPTVHNKNMENLNLLINKNDVSNVDYTIGLVPVDHAEEINKLHCDNVVIYYCAKDSNNKPKIRPFELDIEDEKLSTTAKERKLAKAILVEKTEKIERVFDNLGISINKTNIKPTQLSKTHRLELAN